MAKFTNYTLMLQQCLLAINLKNNTHSLGPTIFQVCNGNRNKIMFPESRLGLKTYLSYALAEAEWYIQRDRHVDWIGKYGPIWYNMRDENGLVNSNYGYQIVNNNDDFSQLEIGEQRVYKIINHENIRSKNDVPCNNFIVVHRRTSEQVDCYSLARSIDLIYGLPFDMIALQGFALKLMPLNSYIGTITFEMIDAHIYNDMIPKLDREHDDNTFKCIAFTDTSYYKKYGYRDFRRIAKNVPVEDWIKYYDYDNYYENYRKCTELVYDKHTNSYPENDLVATMYNRRDCKLLDDTTIIYNTYHNNSFKSFKYEVYNAN